MDKDLVPVAQPIPEIDHGMPVEVMKDFDTVLMFGELTSIAPNGMTIRRTSSGVCFPVVEEDSAVLIRCYDVQGEPVLLQARVAHSSGMKCSVRELELIPYKTGRKHIRYPLCPPAMVSVLKGGAMEGPQPCHLLNISSGGACIVAEGPYTVGQDLCLQIMPEECAAYLCKVMRATPRRGCCFEYGLSFEPLNKEQEHFLEELLREWSHIHLQEDHPGY